MKMLMKASALAGAVIDWKKCTLKVRDGGSNVIAVALGEGSVTWSEKKTMEYILDGGLLENGAVRQGDEVPLELSFESMFDYVISDAGTHTPYEILMNVGGGYTSTDDDGCNAPSCDIELAYEPDSGCGVDEFIQFLLFRCEDCQFDPKGGKISFSGKCAVTAATITSTEAAGWTVA